MGWGGAQEASVKASQVSLTQVSAGDLPTQGLANFVPG
jgi:hypothetical protein